MPIYDFKCQVCNKEFEMILKMDEDITRYPGCENVECFIKKIPSACGIKFNGPGFYINDYKEKK
jgi:putative FmdB family regulatory protein